MWRDGRKDIWVAVKLLMDGATEMDKVKFLQEAAIMAQFTHPNVVSLYGVVSKSEPVSLSLKDLWAINNMMTTCIFKLFS